REKRARRQNTRQGLPDSAGLFDRHICSLLNFVSPRRNDSSGAFVTPISGRPRQRKCLKRPVNIAQLRHVAEASTALLPKCSRPHDECFDNPKKLWQISKVSKQAQRFSACCAAVRERSIQFDMAQSCATTSTFRQRLVCLIVMSTHDAILQSGDNS